MIDNTLNTNQGVYVLLTTLQDERAQSLRMTSDTVESTDLTRRNIKEFEIFQNGIFFYISHASLHCRP